MINNLASISQSMFWQKVTTVSQPNYDQNVTNSVFANSVTEKKKKKIASEELDQATSSSTTEDSILDPRKTLKDVHLENVSRLIFAQLKPIQCVINLIHS